MAEQRRSRSRSSDVRRRILTEILRSLRGLRGDRSRDVAGRMGLEPRTYERFEAGEVRPEVDRIIQLAEALRCDPIALFCAVYLERPALAAQCADNKLMMTAAYALERLSRRYGDRIRELETGLCVEAFDRAFDWLASELDRGEAGGKD